MRQMAPIEKQDPSGSLKGFLRRLGWFVLLWLGGVAVVGTVALILRLWIA